MKQTSLIINIVLAAAVIVLYILHFSSPKTANEAEGQATSSETCAPSGSIVYIQIDSLINQYDMFNDLKTEFQSKAEMIQSDIEKKDRSFQRDANDFRNKVDKGLVTRSQAEEMQQKLMVRQQELQEYVMQKQSEMSEEEAVMYNKVLDALNTYLDKYNKTKNYALILTTSASTNAVIKGDTALDITTDVLKGLNEEYIKTKKK